MKKLPVDQAVGEVLCHDMTAILADGFKGVRFKRGHVIREEDIPELLSIGKGHIFVWDPARDEVHEDDAGLAVTEAICGPGVGYQGPSEGKFSITAGRDGLFVLNREGLRAVNGVPDFTVATIPGDTAVRAGDKLAGARIVPLVTARENVDRAVALGEEFQPVLQVLPFLPLKLGVVITGTEVYTGRIQDRFEPVIRRKTEPFGARVLGVTKCPDDTEAIAAAAANYLEKGADLIVFSGGMSVDPDDLTPTAIRRTGADVVVQGIPVQPGNMLMVAYLGDTCLVGVPGATMHHKATSFDFILPRIFAGRRLAAEDFSNLGEGGLCVGCEACTYPICYFGRS